MKTKENMIEEQLKARDIYNEKVLKAMEEVDRESFLPDNVQEFAYEDSALPIGGDQTMSQPYIVAYMAQVLDLQETDVVLEVGTGSGYNATVMSRITSHVYSIEIVEWLAKYARENFEKAGLKNISARYGDGYKGWPEKAPFDKIVLTAAAPRIPEPLKEQLKVGGLLLAPISDTYEKLILLEKKDENDFSELGLIPVRFVPMGGEVRKSIH